MTRPHLIKEVIENDGRRDSQTRRPAVGSIVMRGSSSMGKIIPGNARVYRYRICSCSQEYKTTLF